MIEGALLVVYTSKTVQKFMTTNTEWNVIGRNNRMNYGSFIFMDGET